MREPLVSVIITTYNRAQLVGEAIECVVDQTYSNFELFIVDDASTDETSDVVSEYASTDDRITHIRHESNRHLSAARNTGIERATGKYVAFLDDDDEWLPTKLEKQVKLAERSSPVVGLVYCWMDYWDGDVIVKKARPKLRDDIFAKTLGSQPIGSGSTWLVRQEVFDAVGGFDEDIPRGVDGDFVRRACRDFQVDYVAEPLVIYNVGHGARRITRDDEEGIKRAIAGQRTKLQKYPAEFENYPRQKAIVYTKMGWRYTQLGDWQEAIRHYSKAVGTAPLETSVYFYVALALYHAILRSAGRWNTGHEF